MAGERDSSPDVFGWVLALALVVLLSFFVSLHHGACIEQKIASGVECRCLRPDWVYHPDGLMAGLPVCGEE